MRVAVALVVVNMRRTNPAFQNPKSLMDGAHEVSMAGIKAHPQIVIMQGLYQLHQLLRRGEFIGYVLYQQIHSQGPGKGPQVLDGTQGSLEFTCVVVLITQSNV